MDVLDKTAEVEVFFFAFAALQFIGIGIGIGIGTGSVGPNKGTKAKQKVRHRRFTSDILFLWNHNEWFAGNNMANTGKRTVAGVLWMDFGLGPGHGNTETKQDSDIVSCTGQGQICDCS